MTQTFFYQQPHKTIIRRLEEGQKLRTRTANRGVDVLVHDNPMRRKPMKRVKQTKPSAPVSIKSFSLPDDLWTALQAQAVKEYRSASSLLRQLIREYLGKQKQQRS